MLKIKFGIQAASMGWRFPLVENVNENLSITIKTAASMMPMAMCKPLPPLVFLEAITAPIRVRMSTETGVASLRYRSTR